MLVTRYLACPDCQITIVVRRDYSFLVIAGVTIKNHNQNQLASHVEDSLGYAAHRLEVLAVVSAINDVVCIEAIVKKQTKHISQIGGNMQGDYIGIHQDIVYFL